VSSGVDIEKLARLAKIDLNEQERATFGRQVGEILNFVEKLSELDTEGVEPMTSALDVQNRFRDDVSAESLSPETATANSPSSEDGFFLVPPVLGSVAGVRDA